MYHRTVLRRVYSVAIRSFSVFRRLDTMNSCAEMRESRSDYLRFLILSVRHGKLVPPFTKLPPPALRPLATIMPKSVYNLIYKGKYTTGDCGPDEDLSIPTYGPAEVVVPSSFFSRQPVPRNGGMVYAAAFSNRWAPLHTRTRRQAHESRLTCTLVTKPANDEW